MKKIILLALLVGLVGCKESNSGLDKKVINTAYDNCYQKLASIVKSPSSLRVNETIAGVYMPEAEDVYRLFSNRIIDQKANEINGLYKDTDTRYRELGVTLDYEAQNSFGVYLPGTFSCSYIYSLRLDHHSPDFITLAKVQNDEEEIKLNGTDIDVGNASNFKLNQNLHKITASTSSEFSDLDKKMYADIMEQHEFSKRDKEAERLKKSLGWD